MTSTEQTLLQAVLSEPANDEPRLAYADWCDENGDEARAEFIRLQIRLAGLQVPKDVHVFSISPDRTYVSGGQELQLCKAGDYCRFHLSGHLARSDVSFDGVILSTLVGSAIVRPEMYRSWGLVNKLSSRCLQLMMSTDVNSANYRPWFGAVPLRIGIPNSHIERGFVSAVRVTPEQLLRHTDAFVAEQPIEQVTITDEHRLSWTCQNITLDGAWLEGNANLVANTDDPLRRIVRKCKTMVSISPQTAAGWNIAFRSEILKAEWPSVKRWL